MSKNELIELVIAGNLAVPMDVDNIEETIAWQVV